MSDDAIYWRLTPVERLELVVFDLELRRAPRALIGAVWLGRDALAKGLTARHSRAAAELQAAKGERESVRMPLQAKLRFLANWRETCEGEITAGGELLVVYAPERLTKCRQEWRGAQVWDIEAFVRFHPGMQTHHDSVLGKVRKDGVVVDLVPRELPVAVPADARNIELWFRNFITPVGGSSCEAWDSRFGQNYWYNVRQPAASGQFADEPPVSA